MNGASFGVFRVISIEGFRYRLDLDDVCRAVADHRASQFLAVHESLGEQAVAVGPILAADFLRWMRAVPLDYYDAEGGAFRDGLEHIGRRQDVTPRRISPIDCDAMGDRDPGRAQHRLGEVLLHRQRGGEDAGMGVGNSQDFEHALDRSVFADAAVQGIEGDVRPEIG